MISVVLCTHNRAASLRKTLESCSQLRIPQGFSWELVLVDNNSKDQTRGVTDQASRDWNLPLRYVFESRQGLSHARNAGVGVAKGEVIAFTDDDVTFDPNWLIEIYRVFTQYDCMGAGGKIVPVWGVEKPQWLVMEGPYKLAAAVVYFDLGNDMCEMKAPPFGANMALRKEAFQKYGLFRPDVGFAGKGLVPGEETELGRRIQAGGDKFIYNPLAIVYHPVEPYRLEKKYFHRWYFGYGRAEMRTEQYPAGEVCYFGVPRYLFRMLAREWMKWMCALDSSRRFYYKLQTIQLAGAIYEARQLSGRARHDQRVSSPGAPPG